MTGKAKSFSPETDDKETSSRVSARERLQLLGIGLGTVTRIPEQALADVSLDSTGSNSRSHYPDISEIYHEPVDRPARWDSDIQDLTGELVTRQSDMPSSGAPEAAMPTSQTQAFTARRRRIAARQLKHFRTFSFSLIAVLVCSSWMFGYVMLS